MLDIDQIAMHAMQGLLFNNKNPNYYEIAETSYQLADAMMSASKRRLELKTKNELVSVLDSVTTV